MKRPILLAIIIFSTSFPAFAGGTTGGMGIVVENNNELTLRFVGEFDNLSLLKASQKTIDTLIKTKDPNVILRLKDRTVRGFIKQPEFIDAISIETDEGDNVVIVNEPTIAEKSESAVKSDVTKKPEAVED